jgi:hypothetical protein
VKHFARVPISVETGNDAKQVIVPCKPDDTARL